MREIPIEVIEKVERWYDRRFEDRTIYGLIDPRDELIHYIGLTVDLRKRMVNHLSVKRVVKLKVDAWILELRQLGLTPLVTVLDTAEGTDEGHEKETELIRKYYIEGHPLKNRMSVTHNGKLTSQLQAMLADRQQ